jgi:cobaltochelatase CobN
MGIQPIWDKRDKIKDVIPIPGNELGRPRIDVLLQMSGLFRDMFPSVALLLDKAVKKAAVLDDVENFIKQHTEDLEQALLSKGYSSEDAKKLATVRVFSAQPGAYGTKVDDMVGASGLWEEDSTIAENAFINMVSYGYSKDMWGENVKDAYRENLKKVDATVHSISSNLYSTMDNDDMFQYLGGLSMAVRHESGKDPDVFISLQKTLGEGHVESLATTIGRELRSRYLNPTWIEGMQKENYAGAREMAEFVENMWGWQVTTPKAIDKTKWEQTYEVYVEDKYGLDIKEFFNQENPWAYQSVTARMLEAVRKDYWQASEEVQRKLAVEYVMNVVEKGVACCDHTCNNPLLNQMVVNIISLPGVMSPEIVKQFKLAIEKAMKKSLEQAVPEREQLLRQLTEGFEQTSSKKPEETTNVTQQESESASATDKASEIVKGYEMEDVQQDDDSTAVSSSGVQWFAAFFVLLIILLIIYGVRRERRIR